MKTIVQLQSLEIPFSRQVLIPVLPRNRVLNGISRLIQPFHRDGLGGQIYLHYIQPLQEILHQRLFLWRHCDLQRTIRQMAGNGGWAHCKGVIFIGTLQTEDIALVRTRACIQRVVSLLSTRTFGPDRKYRKGPSKQLVLICDLSDSTPSVVTIITRRDTRRKGSVLLIHGWQGSDT